VPPAEPERHDILAGDQQIPVLVVPPVLTGFMADATVELDHEAVPVVTDVSVDGPVLGPLVRLPVRTRQTMSSFDPTTVARLEYRLDPVSRLLENLQ
jgi:hypothetical protein